MQQVLIENILSKSVQEGKADACTNIGGTCLDYTAYKCTAGYVTGLCAGASNIKCCQKCDATCN